MEKVTMYKVNGKIFQDYRKAEEYERLCKKVNGIMAQLLPRTDDVEYGRGFNKHNLKTLDGCYKAIIEVLCNIFPELNLQKYLEYCDRELIAPNNRFVTELGDKVSRKDDVNEYTILHSAIYRFRCIDFKTGFEFSQPYYVTHHEEFFDRLKEEPVDVDINYENLPF